MVSKGIKRLSFGALLFAVISLTSFAQTLVDKVVASVNGEPILESDVVLGEVFYNTTDRERVIEKLAEDWLLSQYVESMGGRVPDEYLDQMVLELAKTNEKSIEEFISDLHKEGISMQDLRGFLRRMLLSTQALSVLLSQQVKVSDVEVEIERLKKGNVKLVRDIDLLVVDKENAKKLSSLLEKERDLNTIVKGLKLSVER